MDCWTKRRVIIIIICVCFFPIGLWSILWWE